MQWFMLVPVCFMVLCFVTLLWAGFAFGPMRWVMDDKRDREWGRVVSFDPSKDKSWAEQEKEQFEKAEATLKAIVAKKRHPKEADEQLAFVQRKLAEVCDALRGN